MTEVGVFVQREKNLMRTQELKEAKKCQRIWEKTTATTRAPLQKVRQGDISPKKADQPVYSHDVKTRATIN